MPIPSSDTLESTARLLKQACFDGDRPAFEAAVEAYTKQWGKADPYARHLCHHVMRETYGLLAFQTFGSFPPHAYQAGRRHRWSMWLSLFPLDYQLGLLRRELRGAEDIQLLDWKAIKWHQYHAISSSPDPEKTFRRSALGGWIDEQTPGPGSPQYKVQKSLPSESAEAVPKTWMQASTVIAQAAYDVAMEMVGSKSWAALQAWFEDAQLNPCAHQHEFYLHYTTATGGGQTLVETLRPLPFWVTCLFSGAKEPGFWEALSRCGGPGAPTLGPAWDDPVRQNVEHVPTVGLKEALPPPDFAHPSEWIQPLAAVEDEVYHSINRTAAAWREQLLEKNLKISGQSKAPSARL